MSEGKPQRFPFVAALLCAACVGAAGWTWMRYSYAWDVTPQEVPNSTENEDWEHWDGRYVRLRGLALEESRGGVVQVFVGPESRDAVLVDCARPSETLSALEPTSPGPVVFGGRVYVWGGPLGFGGRAPGLRVNATASRFTGASIAGLAVGAMGVFVFTVALRHWLVERRKFWEAERA